MAKAKKSTKKQAKEAAPAATPPTDEAQAAAAAEEQAKAEAAAAAEKAKADAAAEKQAKEAAKTVQVIVGPNGAAGRIVLNRTVYDGVTPQPMARADFERLRAAYDLQEAKKK